MLYTISNRHMPSIPARLPWGVEMKPRPWPWPLRFKWTEIPTKAAKENQSRDKQQSHRIPIQPTSLHIRNLLILKEAEKKKKITFSGDKITSMLWNLIKWLRTNFPSCPGDTDLEEEDSASQLSGEGDSCSPLPNPSKTSREYIPAMNYSPFG